MTLLHFLFQSVIKNYFIPGLVSLLGLVSLAGGSGQYNEGPAYLPESGNNPGPYNLAAANRLDSSEMEVKGQAYWISCILKACQLPAAAVPGHDNPAPVLKSMGADPRYWKKEVDKFTEREKYQPLEMMRIDRFYWSHYLRQENPEVE